MKRHLFRIALLAVALAAFMPTEAKQVKTSHLYIFGFSASFKDSVVYFTDIQDVEGAWVDSKTKFLLGRDGYSYQLKNYMTDSLSQPNRVSLVIYSTEKKKAEKKYLKMRKKYTETKGQKHYDIRYLPTSEFRFEAIDMSPDED